MGEAFVALADDATATHWNPAGLGRYPLADLWLDVPMPELRARRLHPVHRFDGDLLLAKRDVFELGRAQEMGDASIRDVGFAQGQGRQFRQLRQIADLCAAQGYGPDRIVIDPSVVRGLGYYTGPVFEAELTFEITDEKGNPRQFGSVAGGGRYDELVGMFEVRRALPSPRRQMVGPFIFFDQMGPAEFITDGGIDVRPHPHIGLATISYLYRGRMHHRDSLGTDAWIEPGAVNAAALEAPRVVVLANVPRLEDEALEALRGEVLRLFRRVLEVDPEAERRQARDRFLQKVAALRGLSHPGIVGVLEALEQTSWVKDVFRRMTKEITRETILEHFRSGLAS